VTFVCFVASDLRALRVLRGFLIVPFVAAALLAQQTAPPVFRSGVEAVQMDVVVTDKDGKPVTGLTKEDFEIFEQGIPQEITVFAPVNTPIEREARRPFDAEPDVQSNTREYRHIYMLMLNGNQLQTPLRARQFLTDYFGDNDIGAVFVLAAARTQDGQDFTSNRRLLLEAVDKYVPGIGFKWYEDFWEHMELMARLPGGRKSVIFFGGLPASYDAIADYRGGVGTLAQEFVHAAIAAASRANISMYSIDVTGVARFNPDADLMPGLTGGFAHASGNDYTATFERLVRETSTYYVLGFNSSIKRKQGRMIQLEARVRRPGLTVRTRSGYVEQLEYIRANMTPDPKRTPVEAALASPLATSGLPMHVVATPFKRSRDLASVALAIELDVAKLPFTQRDGRFITDFDVQNLATDATKKIHPEYRHRGKLTLDAATHARVTRSGLRIVSQFELPAGRYQVRVASARGGTKGGVLYDLVVPDFEDGPLAMSGVALTSLAATSVFTLKPDRYRRSGKGVTKCEERVCQANTVFDDLLVPYDTKGGEMPLLRDVLPAPVTTTREFTATDTLALYAEVYDNRGRRKTDDASTIRLTATLHNAESIAVGQASDERRPDAPKRPSGGHGFTLRLPLQGVPAGDYVLRVEATAGPEEKETVSRAIPIRVK
jgi:VWFA-related protein